VYWGNFGHVAASLEGLRWFRATSLDYVILLTGQCYPLVPIGDIENYLGELGGKSLIQHEAFPLPSRGHLLRVEFDCLLARLPFRLRGRLDDSCDYVPSTKPSNWGDRGGLTRIYSYHLFFRGRRMRVPFSFLVRNLPLQLHPYGGSSYWCLSRKCVDYVLKFCDENPEIISFFKNVQHSDEAFFQTILGNSHLRSELIDEEIHYLEWEHRNSSSPNILTNAEKALASGKWFGRKFESNDVLDEVDRQVAYCAPIGALQPNHFASNI
jgi:glycosyltransferase involved in cell wall biosynthesis